jgi:hypothetical protein
VEGGGWRVEGGGLQKNVAVAGIKGSTRLWSGHCSVATPHSSEHCSTAHAQVRAGDLAALWRATSPTSNIVRPTAYKLPLGGHCRTPLGRAPFQISG